MSAENINQKPEHNGCYDILKLDNQLCFSLYVCSKEIIRMYKPLLDPFGLTYTGYIVMMALWEEDQITVKDLGSKLYLDSGTLTPLLKKLEALGYINRTRSSLDERNVYIKLTRKGQDFKEEALKFPEKLVCALDMDMDSAGQLLSCLHGMMKHLNSQENI
jgi:DNA-binding MarR family transcriptional regulator